MDHRVRISRPHGREALQLPNRRLISAGSSQIHRQAGGEILLETLSRTRSRAVARGGAVRYLGRLIT